MIYSTKALIQSIEKNSVSLNVTFIPIVGETYKGHFLLKREDIDNQFTKIEEKELKIQISSEEFS